MPISPKTAKSIDASANRFINYLKYKSIGPHGITATALKDLVRHGWITNIAPAMAVAEAYTRTQAKVADSVVPMGQRKGALDFLERMFARYAEKAGTDLKTDVAGIVEASFMPVFDKDEGGQIYGLIKDPKKWGKHLGEALHGKVDNWRHRWSTIVKTELARASNWGAVDAILHNNPDKEPEEIHVFKAGPNDGDTCEACRKFWFTDGGKFKVYRLSELMANGTNIGRKAREWEATVDPTHPHCRHLMVEMRPGYGFDESNNLQYISKDHSEHKLQRSK
jgi:hypothetical protein